MKSIFTVLALSVLSAVSFARPYGEAGCGLGSVIIGKEGNQVLAATTNGTSWTNVFGITSGTSNCTDGGAVAANKTVPMFIDINRLVLAKESSRGQGEAVAGLASLLGCSSTKLGNALKQNYAPIFVDTQMKSEEIQLKIEEMVKSDPAGTCKA